MSLVKSILGTAADLVEDVVGLLQAGRVAEAEAKVARFQAAARAELSADRREAEELLEDRFG